MDPLMQKFLTARRVEYVRVDGSAIIRGLSDQAARFAESPNYVALGEDVRLGFPELYGLEDLLKEAIATQSATYPLQGIGRYDENGHPRLYFDLQIIGDRPKPHDRLDHDAQAPKDDDGNGDRNPDRDPTSDLAPDPDGIAILFLEDVTEQCQAQQHLVQSANEMGLLLSRLETSEKYITNIVSTMADGLIVVDSHGTITTVNAAACTLLGYDSDRDLLGKALQTILVDVNLAPAVLQLLQDRRDEGSRDVEIVCRTRSGGKIVAAFSCATIRPEGAPDDQVEYIYVFRDATQRRLARARMEVEYNIVRILSTHDDFDAAVPRILQTISYGLDWQLAQLWVPAPDGSDSLVWQHAWFAPRHRAAAWATRMPRPRADRAVDLPGHIWTMGQPCNIEQLGGRSGDAIAAAAQRHDLRSAFGFPILYGEERLAIALFYGQDPRPDDDDLWRTAAAIGNQLGQFIKRREAEAALKESQRQTEQLLLSILPVSIADRLKQAEVHIGPFASTIAESFAEVTVMFADLVGFTEIAARLSPIALVEALNQIFSSFDRLSERYGLEKIKTIGDAYMVVGGLPERRSDHAEAIAAMALDMQTAIAQFNAQRQLEFNIRVGIHTGPVVAGVIGLKKFAYDLWGDTVNVASRMESHGMVGRIQVSDATYQRLRGGEYRFERRGEIAVKGKGTMTTYFLVGRREA